MEIDESDELKCLVVQRFLNSASQGNGARCFQCSFDVLAPQGAAGPFLCEVCACHCRDFPASLTDRPILSFHIARSPISEFDVVDDPSVLPKVRELLQRWGGL
jgi:hypothetical protein